MSRAKRALVIGIDGLMAELVWKFADEGAMPNFGRLLSEGAFAKALPSPPVDTPTNWTTLSTGAWTGTHGCNTFSVHYPGEAFEQFHSSRVSIFPDLSRAFHWPAMQEPLNRINRAENLWDAAVKGGKRCVLVNWPGGYPPTREGLIAVDGAGPYCSRLCRLTEPHRFATRPGDVRETIPMRVEKAGGWRNLPEFKGEALEWAFPFTGEGVSLREGGAWKVKLPDGKDAPGSVPVLMVAFLRSRGNGFDTVLVCDGKDGRREVARLKRGEWSGWIHESLEVTRRIPAQLALHVEKPYEVKGRLDVVFRLKLEELSADGSDARLYCTSLFNLTGWAHPAGVATELIERLFELGQRSKSGKMPGTDGTSGTVHPPLPVCAVSESVEDQAAGIAIMAEYFGREYPWDLMMAQVHAPDGVEHLHLSCVWPDSPVYTPERAEKSWEALRREHEALDKMVGRIVAACADEETLVAIVSDHASLPTKAVVWLPPYFEEAGLTSYRKDGDGRYVVDWSRTKAFAGNYPLGQNVWVNLKGRDPHGIIEPGDEYERVRGEAIEVLRSIRDPKSGEHVFPVVMKKEDAAAFGQWGDRVGDVVFYYAPGYIDHLQAYGGGPIGKDDWLEVPFRPVSMEFGMRGCHHCHFPTAELGGFSVCGICLLRGPGVKEGYRRKTPIWTVDVVPTVAHICGLPLPSDCECGVAADMLATLYAETF